MRSLAKLALFLAVLATAFGLSIAIGAAMDPVGMARDEAPAVDDHGTTSHEHRVPLGGEDPG